MDGKGSPLWETYWKLAGMFGPAKNPSPKITAKLYRYATVGFHPDHLQEKALELVKATSDPKFLPQLAKWLEGEGYRNPTQAPQVNGHAKRTHEADEIFMKQLKTAGGDW